MALADTINTTARKLPAWPIFLIGAIWAGWLFYLALTNPPSPEPINWLEREYGDVALKLLIAGLCITPLRNWFGVNLIKFRRAIGVTTFFFVLAHFLVWVLLDVQSLWRVWEEILKRPYVTVGFLAFLMLLPLALTSNNWSVRKLGPTWRKLHKLTYPAVILGAVHYVWLVKGFQIEPLIYLTVAVGLVALRYIPKRRRATA